MDGPHKSKHQNSYSAVELVDVSNVIWVYNGGNLTLGRLSHTKILSKISAGILE